MQRRLPEANAGFSRLDASMAPPDVAPGYSVCLIGWEEVGWQTAQSGREALAIALTGMMQDGEITRERALVLAHMALHDNAAKLYGWDKQAK